MVGPVETPEWTQKDTNHALVVVWTHIRLRQTCSGKLCRDDASDIGGQSYTITPVLLWLASTRPGYVSD